MPYTTEQTAEKINMRAVAQFLGLASLATMLPFFIHLQWITGPLVNAILIVVLFLIGLRGAVIVALVPSLMALSSGLLPAVLAPVVPFIMISNLILIFSLDWIYQRNKNVKFGYWLGLIAGASAKFLFLLASVSWITRLLLKQELAVKVGQMMSWPQLATALAGGVIAWAVLKWLKRI